MRIASNSQRECKHYRAILCVLPPTASAVAYGLVSATPPQKEAVRKAMFYCFIAVLVTKY